jgi:Holliday junction resolvase RusA-like endonuclease
MMSGVSGAVAPAPLFPIDQRPPEIRLLVIGHPAPAGSKRAVRNKKTGSAYVIDANKNARPWKQAVAAEARVRYGGNLLRGALEVEMTFYRARPKSHFGTGRNADKVKESAPEFPTGKPDALKLARGVEDALTGVVWHDDAQIVNERLAKRYGEPERVEVVIRILEYR